MAIEELSCIPERFTAGDTVKVRFAWSQYSASLWNLAVAFTGPSTFQGTVTKDAEAFILTIEATATEGKPVGRYAYALRVTEISTGQRTTPATGIVNVAADPFSTQAPSAAALLVATLETAIQKLSSKTVQSATVNGKSFSLIDIEKLHNLLRRARADLQTEQDDGAAIGGRSRSSLIRIRA